VECSSKPSRKTTYSFGNHQTLAVEATGKDLRSSC
jgi:hypothetical protein